ncbi:helix-turn-helix domain-containing protein [Pseudonocardia sp. CA-107938]|uniref:helix-turn-helix domain-containing protein n=1 Tax=Pseudonocardia sp. CA-107938 TaxID=3240021 RepID=UPI003D923F56
MSDGSAAAELAATLRRLRGDAGITGAELGARIGASQATISRFESGRLRPSPLVAGRIGLALRLPRPAMRRLIELARDAAEEQVGIVTKRVLLQQGVASLQRRLRHRQRSATHVATFCGTIVPGLLQCEAYARALIADRPISDGEREDWVRERMGRQLHMVQPGRSATQIMAESALHWGGTGPAVMAEQCDHLAWLATNRPEWHIGVIPRRLPAGTSPSYITNDFNIHDSSTVLLGTTAGNAIITDPQIVADHVELFGKLQKLAIFGAEAAALFTEIAELYRAEIPR